MKLFLFSAVSWGVLLFLCAGCILGPNYRAPRPFLRERWSCSSSDSVCIKEGEEPLVQWWEVFDDPLLNCLIVQAARHNHDIQAAKYNIFAARAGERAVSASYFPQIAGDINASRTKFSKNGPVAEFQGLQQPLDVMPQVQRPLFQNLFNWNFDASWEIDLFGKIYRRVEEADEEWRSAIASHNDILLSVFAEVAKTYVDIRAAQHRLLLRRQEVALLAERVVLTRKRLESGLDNGIDLESMEAELATARSLLPDGETEVVQGVYVLSVLIGEAPEDLLQTFSDIQPLPCFPREVAVGLRSDLLRRRPDVRKAEHDLHAATARIGVAVSDFFPSFSLLGFFGLQSLALRNFLEMRSSTWSYGADFPFPVFQGGRLCANLRVRRAEAAREFQRYQQVVLLALRDAENALVAYVNEEEARRQLNQKVLRVKRERDLTWQRMDVGVANLLDVLQLDRQVVLSQQELLDVTTLQLIDLIALYKALGGGWQCENRG